MGIPKYFRWLTNKYNDLIIDDNLSIDNLFLDANCLIHPCCRKILDIYPNLIKLHNDDYNKNKYDINNSINIISKLEKLMFQEIVNYIDYLYDFVKPKKLLYISIDGVAPRAKMEQQRKRRYRSQKEKDIINSIYKKNNQPIKPFWDTNAITPGSLFMLKLSDYLQKNFKKKLNLNIILSDSSIPGEGEHKIMSYIRENCCDEILSIYGLDADLIMLSLCLNNKVYLLRESINFGKVNMDTLLYFSIEKLKNYIVYEIKNEFSEEEFEIENNVIIDYVFLCFLVGNDFLPTLINLDIRENSISTLLEIYIKILKIRKKYLIENLNIDFTFLQQILSHLYNSENYNLIKIQKNINRRNIPKITYENNFEMMLGQLKYYPLQFKHKTSRIQLGSSDWQKDYYKYYFNINSCIDSKNFINSITIKYLEGLQWTLKYYTQGCPCWKWYYPFRAAPCLRE